MSEIEMMQTITRKIEKLSEKELASVNEFIDKLSIGEEIDLLKHMDEIILERKDVLKKLAE